MLAVAVILVVGLALLAPAKRPASRRRLSGWACLFGSLVLALIVDRWLGLAAWIGLVPLAAGGILLYRSYRPATPYAVAIGVACAIAIGWLGRYQ